MAFSLREPGMFTNLVNINPFHNRMMPESASLWGPIGCDEPTRHAPRPNRPPGPPAPKRYSVISTPGFFHYLGPHSDFPLHKLACGGCDWCLCTRLRELPGGHWLVCRVLASVAAVRVVKAPCVHRRCLRTARANFLAGGCRATPTRVWACAARWRMTRIATVSLVSVRKQRRPSAGSWGVTGTTT